MITASEARELAQSSEYNWLEKQIEEAAERGEYSYIVDYPQVNWNQIRELEDNGFIVDRIYDDPEDDNNLTGFLIMWS